MVSIGDVNSRSIMCERDDVGAVSSALYKNVILFLSAYRGPSLTFSNFKWSDWTS